MVWCAVLCTTVSSCNVMDMVMCTQRPQNQQISMFAKWNSNVCHLIVPKTGKYTCNVGTLQELCIRQSWSLRGDVLQMILLNFKWIISHAFIIDSTDKYLNILRLCICSANTMMNLILNAYLFIRTSCSQSGFSKQINLKSLCNGMPFKSLVLDQLSGVSILLKFER